MDDFGIRPGTKIHKMTPEEEATEIKAWGEEEGQQQKPNPPFDLFV